MRIARVTSPTSIGSAAAVVLCVGLATGWAFTVGAPAAAQSDPDLGRRLYLRDCASCHGGDGEGTARGVPLTDSGAAAADFYLSTGRMPIADPDAPVERSEPAYSGAALDALVEHVASFGDGPPVPDLTEGAGRAAVGGDLYRRHCAQCHGSAGVGVALAADVTAPPVLKATPLQVAESLVVGPGAMPSFHPATFGDDEVASVVAYVAELQEPEDRGGLPLARSGRLDELFVAWGVGVLGIVLVIRWVARP